LLIDYQNRAINGKRRSVIAGSCLCPPRKPSL